MNNTTRIEPSIMKDYLEVSNVHITEYGSSVIAYKGTISLKDFNSIKTNPNKWIATHLQSDNQCFRYLAKVLLTEQYKL